MQSLVLYDYYSDLFLTSSAGPWHLGMRLIYSILNVVSCPDPFQKNRGFPEKGSGHETLLNAANIDQNMYLSVVFYSTQCITTTQYMILILHVASSMERYAHLEYRINTHTSVFTFHALCHQYSWLEEQLRISLYLNSPPGA